MRQLRSSQLLYLLEKINSRTPNHGQNCSNTNTWEIITLVNNINKIKKYS